PLTLTAAFQGITHLKPVNGLLNVPDEHQAQLFINQEHVLNTSWNGQTTWIASVDASLNIPQNILHHGYNSFRVYDANPGSTAVCTLALNWVEIKYQRLYVADKDYLKFTIPDNAQPGYYSFTIRNFKSPAVSVYRINNSVLTGVTTRNLTGPGNQIRYAAQFQAYVQSTQNEFIAVSDQGKLRPVSIEQVSNAGLSTYDYSADYIMITSRQLDDLTKKIQDPSNPAAQLASWYNSHGTKVLLVDAAEVYDDFNYGIKSPYAIKSFISYAYHHWSVAPKYVLLVGTGSWNTKNGNDASNLIPVMMMQTYDFGAAASDNWYACVDGDDPIPDVAIGRIPAKNVDQVKAAVDKILSYYSNTTFGWQNTALLIGGEESTFHSESDLIARTMIPPRFFVKQLYTSIQNPAVDTKYYGVTQDLLNDFNQGLSVINYMGHGGGAIWADNGILTNDAVQTLANKGKYPFVSSMTCFAGAFDGQIGQPLVSTLLLAQDKGAIGVIASAGLGWMYNDFFMDTEIFPLLFDSTSAGQSVGTDMILGKSAYYASYFFWPQAATMLNQYNLLGDPALKIQMPASTTTVRLNSYTAAPGQNVTGTISNGPANGKGVVQITNAAGYPVAQSDVTLDGNGSANFSIQFPGGFTGQSHVKAYTYTNSVQSSGSIDFSTGSSFGQITNFGITAAGSRFQVNVAAVASSASTLDSLIFVGAIYKSVNSTADVFVANLRVPLSLSPSGGYFGSTTLGRDTLNPGEVITGGLNCTYSDGTMYSTAQANYTVPGAADLSAFSSSGYTNVNSTIKVIADSVVRIEGLVYDLNSVPVQNVRVDFFDGTKPTGQFIGSARVSFDTTTQKLASIPCNLSTGNHTVYMYLVFDSLTNGFDLDPANNMAFENVNVDFSVADSVGVARIDSTAWMSGLARGQIVETGRALPCLYPQPFVIPARSTDGTVSYFRFEPLKTNQSGNYGVSLKIYSPDTSTANNLQALRVYEYDPRTRTLNVVGGSYNGDVVTATANQPGIFTAAYSTDQTPPQVTISAGDQFFTNGDYVLPNPQFTLLMHDEDGIDLNRSTIDFQLDGQRIDPSLITIPDSVSNPTSVSATAQLPVKDGTHTIEVTVRDAVGNVSNLISASFVVRSDFSLRVYGAFPDPFVDHTIIAFEVTSGNPIDAVQIKIYSVSGRLVKTIRYPSTNPNEEAGLLEGGTGSPTAVGYHEAWWDGRDNYGNQVANGVYFYRVTLTSGGKNLEYIGKMARLR
ncbi:MAG: C25 family cysteine peptidase, partial [Bacteroidetes bacterium]|nr:C25 family cysteine peptidase [Bacteroidota bacterium]